MRASNVCLYFVPKDENIPIRKQIKYVCLYLHKRRGEVGISRVKALIQLTIFLFMGFSPAFLF